MQNDLIMNQLPLPKFYDGQNWNTVAKPSRKYIPQYLHQDLPQLRHLYIKQIFKSMGKFNCPNLQFFNKMIKPKRMVENNAKKQQKSSLSIKKSKALSLSYNNVKEQLQYALITTDRASNVIDDLVIKAQKVIKNEKNIPSSKKQNFRQSSSLGKRKIGTSIQLDRARKTPAANNKQKYFQKTVDLVFKNRRNSYIQNLKRTTNENQEEVQKIYQRLNELKLMAYQNDNENGQFSQSLIGNSRS